MTREGHEGDEAMAAARLVPPTGPCRLVIDSDAANEIDDQFALVWALQSSERLSVEATIAAPYSFGHLRDGLLAAWSSIDDASTESSRDAGHVDSFTAWAKRLRVAGRDPLDIDFVAPSEGMERSFDEIGRVYECTGTASDGRVFRGAERYLTSADVPAESAGVARLIELAMATPTDDDPLFVVAIGCLTNVASALITEPAIAERIVVLWTAGYPTWCPRRNSDALNLAQDPVAARVLFNSGVPVVYFPGYYIGAQLRLSLPDVNEWVLGRGSSGEYLHGLYVNNPLHEQRGISDHFGRSWVMWDMITIAWLIEPGWVPSELTVSPTIDDELRWRPGADSDRQIREAYDIDRDAIFRDFFTKLDAASS